MKTGDLPGPLDLGTDTAVTPFVFPNANGPAPVAQGPDMQQYQHGPIVMGNSAHTATPSEKQAFFTDYPAAIDYSRRPLSSDSANYDGANTGMATDNSEWRAVSPAPSVTGASRVGGAVP